MPEPRENDITFLWMSPDEIQRNPRNWRKHPQRQRRALHEGMRRIGWLKPLIYNSRTERLIDGHLRLEEAIESGYQKVPVAVVDVSDEDEAAALASLDTITTMATPDDDILEDLLKEVDDDFAAILDLVAKDDEAMDEVLKPEKDSKSMLEPDVKTALVPGEEYNYVMILFRSTLDWLSAQEHFQLEEVEDPFSGKVGLARVIDGAEYLKRVAELRRTGMMRRTPGAADPDTDSTTGPEPEDAPA